MSSSAVGLRFNPASLAVNWLVVVSLACVVEMVFLTTGLPAVGLILLTPPAGFLLLRYWRFAALNGVVLAAVGPLLAYLLFAMLYGVSRVDDWALLYQYLFSCVLVAVIAAHVVRSGDESVRRLTRLARDLLFFSAVGVVLSPWYYPYLDVNPTNRMLPRYGGLFANPNEASLMAVVLLNFVLYRPYRRLIPNGLALAAAAAALAFSLSRTGLVLFFLSLALFLFHRRPSFVVALGFLVMMPLAFVLLAVSFEFFLQSDLATLLTPQQVLRIEEMRDFFAGRWEQTNFRDTTVGYRDILWARAFAVIGDNFPHGAGLGAFHHLEEGWARTIGSEQNILWLGVHNMYLMIAGEAGVVVFALLAACYGRLLARSWFEMADRLPFSLIFVTLTYWMTTNSALGLRYEIVVFGIAVGVLGRTRAKRFRPRGVGRAGRGGATRPGKVMAGTPPAGVAGGGCGR